MHLSSDFDDEPTTNGPSGLAATQVFSQTPAAANLLAGTSSNPLDDLVSIFGGGGAPPPTPQTSLGIAGFGGLGDFGVSPSTPIPPQPQTPLPQQQRPEEDLLGLF